MNKENSQLYYLAGLFILLAIVSLVWFFSPVIIGTGFEEVEDKAQYGDSFGALNALFTGLAFAGLIYTIILQQKELKLQRNEFMLQVEEMKEARKEFARQNELTFQQNELARANLKMMLLNVSLKQAEIESQRWTPGARASNIKPTMDKIRTEMQTIIDDLPKQDA